MSKKTALLFSVICLAGMSVFSPARADGPELVGTFGNWTAYRFSENGQPVCYMASKPVKAEGNYTKRDDIFALITHRPAEGSRDVFSYITGYTFKPDAPVNVEIDGQTFNLFSQADTAWAADSQTDNALSAAVRAGSKMVVRGESARGTKTTDTFSLSGTSAAYEKINSLCP